MAFSRMEEQTYAYIIQIQREKVNWEKEKIIGVKPVPETCAPGSGCWEVRPEQGVACRRGRDTLVGAGHTFPGMGGQRHSSLEVLENKGV